MQFKKLILLNALLVFSNLLLAQSAIDQVKDLNGLALSSPLENLESDLQLITGDETIFQNRDYLARHVKKNLEIGVQEGIYLGHTLNIVNGNESPDLRLTYFTNSLFKCRWTFEREDFPNPQGAFKNFISYFSNKFGPPTEIQMGDTFIWKGEVNRLMLNYFEGTIQIEWRDDTIENQTKQLIKGQ